MPFGRPSWLNKVSRGVIHTGYGRAELRPTLLVLAELAFECANVLDAMFEYHALCRQLLVHFPAQVV